MNTSEINNVKTADVDLNLLSPAMRQYVETKKDYTDAILLYRMGDFYETFFEDAVQMSRVLDITLTSRDAGKDIGRVPLAGIPAKAVNSYVERLLAQNIKVAVCEQLEDPKLAKGIVKRGIVRIITPGTVLDSDFLQKNVNNYICALFKDEKYDNLYGLAYADITTCEFKVTQGELDFIVSELARIKPSEIIAPTLKGVAKPFQIVPDESVNLPENIVNNYNCTKIPTSVFDENFSYENLKAKFNPNTLDAFGYQDCKSGFTAAGALLAYIWETTKDSFPKFERIESYIISDFVSIDYATRRNLELTETIREKSKKGSLLWAIDNTKTNMGARLLKNWLCQPLKSPDAIISRQNYIGELVSKSQLGAEISQNLENICDIERIATKISNGTALPKDFLGLKNSLFKLTDIIDLCSSLYYNPFSEVNEYFSSLMEYAEMIDKTIDENAQMLIKEGGIIKDGVNSQVDYLRDLLTGGEKWLAKFEEDERAKTGIDKLKVGYNRVFGYYIEISNSNKSLVPANYVRKQTLTNGERYITDELKHHEDDVLSAKFKVVELEYKLFSDFREYSKEFVSKLREVSECIAKTDVYAGLAITAVENNYCRPIIDDSLDFIVKNGRHAVLDKIMPLGEYVENDLELRADSTDVTQFMILTGPNMAGKSTYMRQNALICILAQIGSWVPADYLKLGVVDKIFTRVGASDDITVGQSTFMVEMVETSFILNSATSKSLVLIDEIGRGTSTYDGVAIAWAVAEYIATKLKSRCIFATHYHELNVMPDKFPQIKNYRITVSEENGTINFLRKIVPGSASRSYGIHVAKMAGLPNSVIARSEELMQKMQKDFSKNLASGRRQQSNTEDIPQLNLFLE